MSENQWPIKPLEDVVEILDKLRAPINSKERESRKGNVPYYGATGQTGWIDDYIFDEELVLLGEDGAPFLDHSKPSAYMIRGKAWVNNHAHVLRSKQGLNNRYLLHYLNQLNYTPYISGTTRAKLPQGPMKQIPIPIPPLNYQLLVVGAIDTQLSRLDETVSTLQGIQAKLKQARASILKAAVEGRLVETATDWKESMRTVGEICLEKPSNGRSVPTQQGGFPVLRLTAMKGGRIDFNEVKGGEWSHADAAKWIVQEGDFFVMRGNGSIKRVGDGALAKQVRFQTAYPDTMIRLRPDPRRCSSGYLLHLWRSPHIRSQIESSARTTAGIYKINQRDIAALLIPIPTLSEQMMIAAEVDRRFSVLDQVETTVKASLARCALLRQAILKRAFEGRLVPALPKPHGPDDQTPTDP